MELFINTHTKVSSIDKEIAIWFRPEPEIIRMKVSKEVYEALTMQLDLYQYNNIANELIMAHKMGNIPEWELDNILFN